MAEPVLSSSTPRPRDPRLSAVAVEASTPPLIARLHALTVHDMPKLPSLAALHALSDRDLPATDGSPMPESTIQFRPLGYTVNALTRFLRHRPDTFVAGDLLVYADGCPDADGRVSPV